jgi:hypothetical protein
MRYNPCLRAKFKLPRFVPNAAFNLAGIQSFLPCDSNPSKARSAAPARADQTFVLTVVTLSFTATLFLDRVSSTPSFSANPELACGQFVPLIMRLSTIAAIITCVVSTSVSAIPTISIKGSKFFTDDGAQFYVKGKWRFPRASFTLNPTIQVSPTN